MKGIRITDLEAVKITSDQIDNCFYVQENGTPDISKVQMRDVFEWMKERAKESGLEVTLEQDRITFKKPL